MTLSSLITRRTLTWIVFCLSAVWSAGILLTRFKVQTDLWAFLPIVGDNPEQQLTRSLLSGQLSHSLVLGVVPKSPPCSSPEPCPPKNDSEARAIAAQLAQDLKSQPGIAEASSGPSEDFASAVHELYFPRRFALARGGPGEAISDENIKARIEGLKTFLGSPKGSLYRSQLVQDPLLYFPEQLERLAELKPSGVEVIEGQFATKSGIALVFCTLEPNLSGEQKAKLYQLYLDRFAALSAGTNHTRLITSGALPFEVLGEVRSKADMQRVSWVSGIMTIVLSLVLFRSALTLLAVALIVALASAFGCAATLLWFGEVHVLTLAFGASLIGVSIDYPLHLLNEGAQNQCSLAEATRRARPGLLIGSITTMVGFLAFGLTSATALLQVAVFSVAGLIAALWTTLYILPLLPVRYGPGSLQRSLAQHLTGLLPAMMARARLSGIVVFSLLGLSVFFVFRTDYQTDPNSLDPSPKQLKVDDRFLRSELGVAEDMLVSTATTHAQALALSYTLAQDLQKRKNAGQILGYRSVAALYVPEGEQIKNRERASSPAAAQSFREALVQTDFEPAAFAQSPLGTRAVLELPLLRWKDLIDSKLGSMVRPFSFDNRNGASIVTQVSAQPEEIAKILTAHPAVVHYQPEKFLALSFSQLARDMRTALIAGLGLVLLIVFARYRDLRSTVGAYLPAALGALGALSVVSWSGPIHVFHLLSAVVVLSMGVDYGAFMVETHLREGQPDAWPSVVSAAASTLISYGCLALSDVPALRDIGLVISIGTTISLLAVPVCYSVVYSWQPLRSAK